MISIYTVVKGTIATWQELTNWVFLHLASLSPAGEVLLAKAEVSRATVICESTGPTTFCPAVFMLPGFGCKQILLRVLQDVLTRRIQLEVWLLHRFPEVCPVSSPLLQQIRKKQSGDARRNIKERKYSALPCLKTSFSYLPGKSFLIRWTLLIIRPKNKISELS